MGRPRKNDGLTKHQRYRLKDLQAYREKKATYARTPEERAKRTAYMREWREKNRARHNELARSSHQRNKHKHIHKMYGRHLKSCYGITEEERDALFLKQGSVCAICATSVNGSGKRRFHLDHCHASGRVRGVICTACNTMLGIYENRFKRYEAAILEYLNKCKRYI
jgi:hypothetical protein